MPAMIVDTHAHLADPAFDTDLEAVLERARGAGVRAVLVVAGGMEEGQRALALRDRHPMVRVGLGVHPAGADRGAAERMVGLIRERRDLIAAIGEVGLDHWVAQDDETRAIQAAVFDLFIDVSLELDLPLNVHTRSAGRVAIERLVHRGARKVQLHAFDGRGVTAQAGLDAGYYYSVPPCITHSRQKRKLVRALPLDRILLETDSPVLGPVPGERNEPANTLVAARVIAEIKGVPVETVLEAAAANTRALYGDRL